MAELAASVRRRPSASVAHLWGRMAVVEARVQRVVEQRRSEFIKAEQLECAASVIIEHAEIVALPKVSLHEREMRTISLSGKTDRNLVADELLDPLAGQLPDQCAVEYGIVAG